jgi:hypothetical protein
LHESEYTYRLPRSTRALAFLLLFATPLYLGVAVGILERSWLVGAALVLPVVLAACLALWLWSKDAITIDSERIRWQRWPLKRSELRWDDVAASTIERFLGTEYARIETKQGNVRRIVLNRVGGQEYRARVLAKLGLD